MIILAIETSCDETSASILRGRGEKLKILSNIVSSQISIHQKYGGVVPEIAAREHIKNINWVIDASLKESKIKPEKIDLIAVTTGPGLITSLSAGAQAAKALSYAWHKPLLAVNHMYSHLAANFYNQKIIFPAVCLVVSGGHTELIYLKNHTSFKKIGETVDDAAGEAFDKVAKLLGLGYPGGPKVSAEAEKFSFKTDNNIFKKLALPRPMINSGDFNFSFSGLKTAVLYSVKKISHHELTKRVPEFCYEFQNAVIEVLVSKTLKATEKFKVKTVILAGGVAANKSLRETLSSAVEEKSLKFLVPELKLCTDNAAMVAVAAYYLARHKKADRDNWRKIIIDSNWELQ